MFRQKQLSANISDGKKTNAQDIFWVEDGNKNFLCLHRELIPPTDIYLKEITTNK